MISETVTSIPKSEAQDCDICAEEECWCGDELKEHLRPEKSLEAIVSLDRRAEAFGFEFDWDWTDRGKPNSIHISYADAIEITDLRPSRASLWKRLMKGLSLFHTRSQPLWPITSESRDRLFWQLIAA